jgi:hypothetical protein
MLVCQSRSSRSFSNRTPSNKALQTDGAIACFSSSLIPSRLNADRAPQLKASVGLLPMMNRRFWFPILASIPITLVSGLIAFTVARVNYGSQWGFAFLFPYSVLIAVLRQFRDDYTDLFFIIPVMLQFPLYGFALGLANVKGKFRQVLIALVALHILATAPLVARWLQMPRNPDVSVTQPNELRIVVARVFEPRQNPGLN